MGRSPWGGGSAIIRPDGSVLAALRYERDTMIVEEIDIDLASLEPARQRLNHPLFKPFWQQGRALLTNGSVDSHSNTKPLTSEIRNIRIAVAQMACSRNLNENVYSIRREIARATEQKADIVIFPELAVTGNCTDDIRSASRQALDSALGQISEQGKLGKIYVIVGTPLMVGNTRYNGAVVIGDDGTVQTRYAQLVVNRRDLFQPGRSTKSLWFSLKGVPSIVTVGNDANWVEIGDLAANRGMYMHLHISYESDVSADQAVLRKQRNLLALRYAGYGATVNAAGPSGLQQPSGPAGGMSMIVSRQGGHNQSAPEDIGYYLPYQTSVVKSVGEAPTMIVATRRTASTNNMDLRRFWRNRNRRQGGQPARYNWISNGTASIAGDHLP